ncbi:MAG: hypothetical protein OXI24_14520 [Candidatus Poribacteria bacterium]|nr:hypothetical protein [Candidatus Poribacteria bacterium]
MLFTDTLETYSVILFEWVKAHGLAVAIVSVGSFIGSILFCTLTITYLPSDYFQLKKQVNRVEHPVLRLALKVLKNLLAAVLIVVGFIQIPLPGQGVLTMLIGIVISDIPGKRRLERRIIRLPSVLSTANGIRSRFRRPLLVLDESLE